MGQQQQTLESVATLRRIMLVVLVAALMALIMAASAMPAMAKNVKGSDGRPIQSGDINQQTGGASVGHNDKEGSCVRHDGGKTSGLCT